MNDKIIQINEELNNENITNLSELEAVRVKFLGKSGLVTSLMKELGKLPAEEKPIFGIFDSG